MAGAEDIKPYDSESAKKEQVAEMFDNISKRYDLLNHLLSLNIDKGWRRKVVSMIKADAPTLVLDVATGTADLAIALAKGTGADITGADISEGMLEVGRGKVAKKGLSKKIVLELGDSENLPYADATFDAITVAFGVRNFQNLHNGLKDMMRVLKPGGQLIFAEHGRAPDANVRKWQDRINPYWQVLAGGCQLNRDIPSLLTEGGCKVTQMDSMYLPSTPKFAGFNYWGTAQAQ